MVHVKVSMILEEPITSLFNQPNSLHAKLLDLGTHPYHNSMNNSAMMAIGERHTLAHLPACGNN